MDLATLVAKYANLGLDDARTLIKQFKDEVTIPFLVRYRKDLINDLTSDDLRFAKQMYEQAKTIKEKCESIKKKLETKGELTNDLKSCIDHAQSIGELEDIYAPYKSSKKTKLSILKECGFDANARNILTGQGLVSPGSLIDKNNELLKNQKSVDDMLAALVADIISGDKQLETLINDLILKERIMVECSQAKNDKPTKDNGEKFENYYNFSNCFNYIKPHQILAINRGEKKKMLKVKFVIPDSFDRAIKNFIYQTWFRDGEKYAYRKKIIEATIKYLLSKKIHPKVKKRIRDNLTRNAERVAVEVFASNLKHLLLTRPVRPSDTYVVLGIDPGFKNGCKVAVMNIKHEILNVTLLNLNNASQFKTRIIELSQKHNVTTIAIGNGQGCRQVEIIICDLIKSNLKVQYVIIPEQGVSVYSCSNEAAEEYPKLEPNFISAISLIKRHLDPLSEYVKVEPKHLGVGMYQHDIDSKKLDEELGEVISECVSDVGVDLNTAPIPILKRVAGLSESKAKSIIAEREKKGGFTSRKQLLDVKNIGPKTYQQCAGFVKIVPETSIKYKHKAKKQKIEFNLLDQTIIHPDDYDKAEVIVKMANLNIQDIGTSLFIEGMKRFRSKQNFEELALKFKTHSSLIKLICDALSTRLDFDIRSKSNEPLFKSDTKSLDDLSVGLVLTGRVENVTPFASFVDIGVGRSALIPDAKCKTKLHLGQTVSVKIENIRGEKVGLQLIRVLDHN